jgi:hypothetical protein
LCYDGITEQRIMKNIILFLATIVLLSCNRQQKEFASIEKGMNKSKVLELAGEPTKKTNVGLAELWTYDASNRTVIFRKDTVYNIITSSEARLDSLKNSMEEAGSKIEAGAKETGKDLKEGADKLTDKADSLLER